MSDRSEQLLESPIKHMQHELLQIPFNALGPEKI